MHGDLRGIVIFRVPQLGREQKKSIHGLFLHACQKIDKLQCNNVTGVQVANLETGLVPDFELRFGDHCDENVAIVTHIWHRLLQ